MPIGELQEKANALLIPQSNVSLTATVDATDPGNNADRDFSPFDPHDEAETSRLVSLFWSMADDTSDGDTGLQRVLDTAQAAAKSHGFAMVRHALMVFATHHPNGRRLALPTFFERYPDITRALGNQPLTAVSAGPEQALDWWREDPFFNEHHEHWHIVYRPSGINGMMKDRHGELFLYMHQQMLARYDVDRLCAGLPPVAPLDDLSAPIAEAYTPIGLTMSYTARPADQPILPFPNSNFTPATLTQWRDAIDAAISSGQLIDDFGTPVPLTAPEHIHALGSTLEATSESVSQQRYGSLHNLGHGLISNSPRPQPGLRQGVMGFPWTSAMDPVFWRWHRMIDDRGATFQNQLAPLTFDDNPEGIIIRNQDVITVTAAQVPDYDTHDQTQLTMWAESIFGGSNWDADFSGDPQVADQFETYESTGTLTLENTGESVTLNYGNHDDFAFVLRVENTLDQARQVTLRCWLCVETEVDNRRAWVEMDTFEQSLPARSRTVIYRSSRQSSIVRKHDGIAARPPRLERAPGGNDQNPTDDDYCDCGWPYSLLLPRGNADGVSFRLLTVVTENDIDMQGHDPICGSVRLCGARNILYPDQRPMGYPFHLNWAPNHSISEWIETNSNMASRPLSILFRGAE